MIKFYKYLERDDFLKLKRGKNKITIKEYAEIRDTFDLKETYIDHK